MTDEVQDTPKSARSEGARNGWKTRQKNKQDAPAKVGGISAEDAARLRALFNVALGCAERVNKAQQEHEVAVADFYRHINSLMAGK